MTYLQSRGAFVPKISKESVQVGVGTTEETIIYVTLITITLIFSLFGMNEWMGGGVKDFFVDSSYFKGFKHAYSKYPANIELLSQLEI